MKLPISPSALGREKTIEQQIQSFGLNTDAEKISVLTRALATNLVESEINNIGRLIFGSQVTLLINITGTRDGITRQEAEAIFEKSRVAFPDLHSNRKFEAWFAYLSTTNLVASNTAIIDITQYGKGFLKYLVDSRQAHQRYG